MLLDQNQEQIKKNKKWPFWLALSIIFVFLIILVGFGILVTKLPENIVARGVTVGQIDLGGLSKEQAERILTRQMEAVENQGVAFVYKDISVNLPSVRHSVTNPEISSTVFDYDSEKTIKQVLSLGRSGNTFNQFVSRFYLRIFGKKIDPTFSLSSEEVNKNLKDNLSSFETAIKDSSLAVEGEMITATKESAGKSFDYSLALSELRKKLNDVDSSEVLLKFSVVEPTITQVEAEKTIPVLTEVMAKGKIFFQSEQKIFNVEPSEWTKWVILKKEKNKILLAIDESFLKKYLQEKVVTEIDTNFEEAKFIVENGKVKEFQSGKAGQKINLENASVSVEKALFAGGERTITLVTEIVEPELTLDKVNSFGIKELLGVGTTNFKGSPVNRRKNIAVGAAALNGILIAPGETFSTITKLKPIDASSGYLPELVIKGSKTVPEYGGGLCQVSTTILRAVLASGLPVVERSAHAYRVSYYEPPVGIDATIYDPSPDFKFLNDTLNYILVQARVEGDNLIFEFWGTKDSRVIQRTDPKVFNIKAPPAPKLIETLDLPIGQKKCTERAHAGADASFEYIVTYADGKVKSEEFKSRYRPWGEVCMIGVEKLSDPTVVDGLISATSTSAVVPVVPVN